MSKLLLLALLFITVVSCSDKDEMPGIPMKSFEDLDVITGIDFIGFDGASIGTWRQPNQSKLDVSLFPIPATDIIALNVSFLSEVEVEEVWIVPASCLKDSTTVDINTKSQGLTYSEKAILDASVENLKISTPTIQLAINLSSLSAGFYKIFYKTTLGNIGWTNIYCDPTISNFPNFDFLNDICN